MTMNGLSITGLDLTQEQALAYFWDRFDDGNRMALLRELAQVVIRRPSDWDYEAIRNATPMIDQHVERCRLGCSRRGRVVHHVIQVQHGGDNSPWNKLGICRQHHALIHPWLPQGEGEFTQVSASRRQLATKVPELR